jgi:hypothetical protein
MRVLLLVAALTAAFLVGVAVAASQPGPVIQELGPVVPTPQPSPKVERHIRLISSLTLGNQPDGDSVISFEATDFGVAGTGDDTKYRTIATEQYSLIEPKPEARELRDEILRKLRDLESDMLRFVEIAGPPRIRDTIQNQGAGVSRP